MSAEGGIRIGRSVRVPSSALTLDGFRTWVHSARFPRRGRFSFIGGDVRVDMSPEELFTHNDPKRDLTVALTLESQKRDLGKVFVDRALLVNRSAQLSTEPDLMFCLWETLESRRVTIGGPNAAAGQFVEVQGAPDLLVEIVSRSSATKDKLELRDAYYRAGIPEYWIVDARQAECELQVLYAGTSEYKLTKPTSDGFQFSTVLGREVKLTRTATRGGGYSYTLHIRSGQTS